MANNVIQDLVALAGAVPKSSMEVVGICALGLLLLAHYTFKKKIISATIRRLSIFFGAGLLILSVISYAVQKNEVSTAPVVINAEKTTHGPDSPIQINESGDNNYSMGDVK